MSDLKGVLAFFIGLIFFILLIAFAIGKIKPSNKPATVVTQQETTPTPAQKEGLLARIKKIFSSKKQPTVTPTPVPQVVFPTLEPAQGTESEYQTYNNEQVQTIPETGAPTLLVPFALAAGGLGTWLKKKSRI